ncbi:TPA: restriction endonuclease subunit S [Escherichia coli]|uniref:Restriction endonuclease n=35 Tax=Enterobacteriaceae TaxID=543 RepID=A0A0S3BBV5_ECOLX|nr:MULTISPECIES: restriction endonuclease subunit S [Enterobacteriaceae]EAA1670719.1 restriction endonuclease [Salmonella enterica subsp. enterica serovar Kentucky]EAB5728718.1 restriction endonuclease [Salmonella enterica subsp. enterica serovar Agona]EBH8413414.1 restriction endonuclease [Salmonella enterica subsp. diarizonae serovar 53:z10:z]EBV9410545.1 restriction endonuclease [Salmonella enterica subsp. arizonae serovar 18:z4,z23:-]EBZ2522804.1 restriction endonuclease [Salmonella enteri
MKKNQLVTLGKHIDILSGCAFPSSGFNRNNGVPLIRIRDILSGKTETYYEGSYDLKYLIKKGDLLVGMDGDFNREYWKGTDALLNQRVCKITPNPETLDKNFLYHFLQKELDKIHATTDVVTVKHLSVKKIQDIKIRLPSLKEQKRIAAILDKADAIRQKREQAIKLADDFLRAKFLEMFGTPANNIHRFPKGTIRDLVDSVNYGTSAKASIDSGEYPILRMGNITYQGRWDFTDLKYLDLSVKEKDKYLVKEGDLLFNRTNSKELVGKTAVYEEDRPMAFAGYLIRVRPNSIGNNYYISGYLNSIHGKITLMNMCKSIVGMANINAQELQNIEILIPPKHLQDEYEIIYKKIKKGLSIYDKSAMQLQLLASNLSNKYFM